MKIRGATAAAVLDRLGLACLHLLGECLPGLPVCRAGDFTIVTKSAGVLRDLDILERLAARNLVRVCLSVTTLDPALARILEPRAAAPGRRLEAIRRLSAAGVLQRATCTVWTVFSGTPSPVQSMTTFGRIVVRPALFATRTSSIRSPFVITSHAKE